MDFAATGNVSMYKFGCVEKQSHKSHKDGEYIKLPFLFSFAIL